jgi:hypothetical protein
VIRKINKQIGVLMGAEQTYHQRLMLLEKHLRGAVRELQQTGENALLLKGRTMHLLQYRRQLRTVVDQTSGKIHTLRSILLSIEQAEQNVDFAVVLRQANQRLQQANPEELVDELRGMMDDLKDINRVLTEPLSDADTVFSDRELEEELRQELLQLVQWPHTAPVTAAMARNHGDDYQSPEMEDATEMEEEEMDLAPPSRESDRLLGAPL